MVIFFIGYWAAHAAYLERGYRAIGGEYCLILITYLAAWKSIHCLFEALEELDYEWHCKKGDVKELLKSEITDDQFLKALRYDEHKYGCNFYEQFYYYLFAQGIYFP